MTPVVDFGERLAQRQNTARAAAQELAAQWAAGADNVSEAVLAHVLATEDRIPDSAITERAVRSTVGAMLSALAHGIPAARAGPTDAMIALLQRLSAREDGLLVALRVQRLLAAELWQQWAAHVGQMAVLASSTRRLDDYTDAVCEALAQLWPQLQVANVSVEELVATALEAPAEEAAEALERLGYPADVLHVAVALPGGADVGRLARHLKLTCATEAVAAGAVIWVGVTRPSIAVAVVEAVAGAPSLSAVGGPVGIGDCARGLEGLRRSHQQALDALRVATLSGSGLTRYGDVALLCVLLADEQQARELAAAELGPLAADDPVALRLRETLAAYLDAGENQVATAQKLFVHEKTVRYRLRQSEELLGRRIGDRRSELGAALMIHRVLGKPRN